MTTENLETAPLSDVVRHLLHVYHQPLSTELPELSRLVDSCRASGDELSDQPVDQVAQVYTALRNELEPHMMKEERVLFPLIMRGDGDRAEGPVFVMESEHETATGLLDKLRELTQGYASADGAPGAWQDLMRGLKKLDTDTREHIRIESKILFPRALEGDDV